MKIGGGIQKPLKKAKSFNSPKKQYGNITFQPDIMLI